MADKLLLDSDLTDNLLLDSDLTDVLLLTDAAASETVRLIGEGGLIGCGSNLIGQGGVLT